MLWKKWFQPLSQLSLWWILLQLVFYGWEHWVQNINIVFSSQSNTQFDCNDLQMKLNIEKKLQDPFVEIADNGLISKMLTQSKVDLI